jgi:uncharacterized protein YndB with AHSA1/START domain
MTQMTQTITPAPVRRSVSVAASPQRAFEVFTQRIGAWWPKASHHIGAVEPETIVIEPHQGGRWFERAADGSECPLGHVLAWEPPSRLLLAWQLSPEWKFDPELITEVEVLFTPDGEGRTRVDLEHRRLERFGERAQAVAEAVGAPNGWTAILDLFAKAAGETR